MRILLRFAAFVVGAVVFALAVRFVRSRRRGSVKPPVSQYEDLISRSGVDGLRRNPCDVDGCVIQLGVRCGGCGVTLYECEVDGACAACGSREIAHDYPVCEECSRTAEGTVRHAPPMCEPPSFVVER